MAVGKGTINDLQESWEGHSMEEVETFLKKTINDIQGGKIEQLTVSIVGSTVRSFIRTDDDIRFKYRVNNLVNGDFDANFRVVITVGDTKFEIQNTQATSGDYELTSPNIASALALIGSNTIPVTIQAYTDSNQSGTRTITYNRMSAVLTTANTINNTDPTRLLYQANFNTDSAILVARFYGASGTSKENEYVEKQINVNIVGQVYVTVPYSEIPVENGDSHAGAHIVRAYLQLSDGESKSEEVVTSFISTTGGVTGDAYITYEDVQDAVQNDYTNINFSCYVKGKGEHDTYPVYLMHLNNTTGRWITDATREVTNSNINTWRYSVPYTDNMLQIAVPSTDSDGNALVDVDGNPVIANSVLIQFNAEPTNVSWAAADNPLILLTAQGRTNNDANVSEWKDLNGNNYEMEFEDMQWDDSGSGWVDQNALRLIGASRARIKNFYPFYNNAQYNPNIRGGGLLSNGLTLKLSFMVTDVSNPDEKVVNCYDPVSGLGFYITGDAIYISVGAKLNSDPRESQTTTGHNVRRFSANTRTDLTIALQPYYDEARRETKHEVRYYINGEIAGFGVTGSATTLTQANANKTLVEFGGSGAAFKLYDFRFYERCLSAFEILQTRTMDLNNSLTIANTFNKNNFYELDGTGNPVITLAQALEYGKYRAANGKTNFAVSVVTDLCNAPEYIGSTKVTNSTDKQSYYLFRFTTDAQGNGIIDPDLTIWIEGITGGALRFRRQGTSTAYATKGNVRVDVRSECHLHHWDALTQTFKDEYEVVVKNAPVWQIPNADAIPCYLLTMKKNPNESTQARNLPTAKWYEDCSRYLATVNTNTGTGAAVYGYEDILTPPQRRELTTIVRSNPNLTRTEQVAKIKTRQTVDGIPSVAFEMVRTEDSTIAKNPLLAQTSFGGQFDLITDKTNMDVFGFGGDGRNDDDFSVEWRNNQSPVCNFHTADISGAGNKKADGSDGDGAIEYRYPDIDDSVCGVTKGLELDGPVQRLFDFVCNCSPYNVNYKYERGVESSSQGRITINGTSVVDNPANRNRKFKAELGQYVVLNQFLFNAIAIDRGLMCDQDVKNQFFTYLTGDLDANNNKLLRLLGYDFDSSWGCDNDNYFRFLYTVLYSDNIYDGHHDPSIDGIGHGDYRGSDLWALIFNNFKDEIATMARYLYSAGLLKAEGVLRYMHENQVDMYNEIMYNANSEYSYTSSDEDYKKAHGSAEEHNEWFVKGRMYFTAGSTFTGDDSSDFAAGVAQFNVTARDNLNEANQYNNSYDEKDEARNWAIDITAYERTYAYLVIDTALHGGGLIDVITTYGNDGMPVKVERPVTRIQANAGIVGQSETRFRIYGGKHIKTIADLSHWYIASISQWGDLINVEELNLGRTSQVYRLDGENKVYSDYINPGLTNLGIGDNIFGSCKVLNLAGCINLAGTVDLTHFPILERFEGVRMNSTTNIVLPSGSSLKVIHFPANLTSINLANKPNVTEISYQGSSKLNTISCSKCNQYTATSVINLLNQIIL